MICNNCGAENKETAKFCKNCGKELAEVKVMSEAESRAVVSDGEKMPGMRHICRGKCCFL